MKQQRITLMPLSVLIAIVAVLALVLSTVQATGGHATESTRTTPVEPESTTTDVRYLEAASPADALQKQEKLDSGVSTQAAGVKYGPCTLTQSHVYVRASTHGVGSKPVTKCSKKVTSIHHKTQLATRMAGLWWKVRSTDSGSNRGAASYTQKNVSHPCKGSKKKVWRASTTGTIVSGGKTYYAVAMSASKKLSCGV